MLGELTAARAHSAANYLRRRLAGRAPIVDFLSLVLAAATIELSAGIDTFATAPDGWRQAVAGALEQLRRADGGYAKTPEGESSSVYHSFLVVCCQQALGLATPDPAGLVAMTRARHRDDGGFVEMLAMRRSGTNPTAAAIGVLSILGGLDDDVKRRTAEFLIRLQNDEGGWLANTRIPIADLLSTFTALVTLADLGAVDQVDLTAARRYAESLQTPTGGFHGAVWDGGEDVEYTFYGLGTLALTSKLDDRPA
jgi:geranylgeranyl transferase type-2 subunit beta